MPNIPLVKQEIEPIASLRGEMIVSCQAEGKDPFNKPEYVALFAQAAIMGGRKGSERKE